MVKVRSGLEGSARSSTASIVGFQSFLAGDGLSPSEIDSTGGLKNGFSGVVASWSVARPDGFWN